MSSYELAILGNWEPAEREALTRTLRAMTSEFLLAEGDGFAIRIGAEVESRDPRSAAVAVYFGGPTRSDVDITRRLIQAGIPVIPVVRSQDDFLAVIPDFLQSINGYRCRADDIEMTELAATMLECVGLLRIQRKAFVSYRRVESKDAAIQLHDLLTARGFDVFLDTYDIRPGDPFQDMLWHRLCDSDVMIMLDTPGYFESKWTRYELGRARIKGVHVLRVVWPGHTPSKSTDLAETIYLDAGELEGPDGPIAATTAERIVLTTERLRSRSIAARHMSITGKLRLDIETMGGSFEGIGANRSIIVRLPDERRIWAYPVVGIPTAETLNQIAAKARSSNQLERPILLYDELGLREAWKDHLKWLNENISCVYALTIDKAGWMLAAWDEPK